MNWVGDPPEREFQSSVMASIAEGHIKHKHKALWVHVTLGGLTVRNTDEGAAIFPHNKIPFVIYSRLRDPHNWMLTEVGFISRSVSVVAEQDFALCYKPQMPKQALALLPRATIVLRAMLNQV